MNASEILHGITGAWRIAMRDPDAARHFNLSDAGFFRSFLALAFALPIIFFTTTSLWRMGQSIDALADVSFSAFAMTQIGGELFYWAIYLLAMVPVARHLKLGASFGAYVVTFNWGVLMTSSLMAVPLLLYSVGLFNGQVAVMLTLPIFGLVAWYRWQIARVVLGATPSAAIAILVFDFVLGAVLDQGLGRLLLTPAAG